MRPEKNKTIVIEQLKKMPIIHIACEKASISRPTYYRWRADDREFQQATDEALAEGIAFINDMSESQVIALVRDKKWPAIRYWLENNHTKYARKILIGGAGEPSATGDQLTPEQQSLIREALTHAALLQSPASLKDETNCDGK